MFQFYSTTCELISETRKALIALNHSYSLIILKGLYPQLVSNENTMFATDSKLLKWHLESLAFNNPFEIIRSWLNSRAHQSNQNYNGKISKAVPTTFKSIDLILKRLSYYTIQKVRTRCFRGSQMLLVETLVCTTILFSASADWPYKLVNRTVSQTNIGCFLRSAVTTCVLIRI